MIQVVVIGGGIAGLSAAAHLAPEAEVTVLEAEQTLAHHSTGRSAAMFVINYGGKGARPLARASRPFFDAPPEGSTDHPLLTPRGTLWVAREDQLHHLEATAADGSASGAGSEMIEPAEVLRRLPVMRPEWVAGGLWEPSGLDLDVAALHQAYVRLARRHQVVIRVGDAVQHIVRSATRWEVSSQQGSLSCDVVVNAAGAWGDVVAGMAGIEPIGLQPMRRTAFMVPGGQRIAGYPMVIAADHGFYFKPDGAQILCSLAEETPDVPGDAYPRMEDVALAIDRINEATSLGIRTVNSQWAGLRTFAPDGDLVIGEEPTAARFFWLVGQGGMGIATSPAYGALLASQVLGRELPSHLAESGVDPAQTAPDRFRRSP